MTQNMQAVRQEWIARVLHDDQISKNYIENFTLAKMLQKADVGYVQNQDPAQHCIDAFQSVISLSLARSEKTRFGNMSELKARDIYPLFGKVVVLNAVPGAGLDCIYEKSGVVVGAQHKSGPNWGNTSSRQKTKENAAKYLRENYDGRECQIVICSENGDGTLPSSYLFDGYLVSELYGTSCNNFFTGQDFPLDSLEREVFVEVAKLRPIPIAQRNQTLIARRAKDLYTQLLRTNGQYRDLLLIDNDGCPIWSNWRQAIEVPSPSGKKRYKNTCQQTSLNI